MDVPGQRQQDEAGARHVFQRRADHCHLRRVRSASGGLHVHRRGSRPNVHEAEPGYRPAVRITQESLTMQQQTTEVSAATYRERIAKLQDAMKEYGLGAVVLEPGPAMVYLTGVRWGKSERTFAVVLPAKGEPVWVLPGFEEMRARELIHAGGDIRVWQDHREGALALSPTHSGEIDHGGPRLQDHRTQAVFLHRVLEFGDALAVCGCGNLGSLLLHRE